MATLTADKVVSAFTTSGSLRIDSDIVAKFKVGDCVVVRTIHAAGHTRLPRYLRGMHGIVQMDHGVFSLPDSMAHGQGERPQHVYSVRFSASELWGVDASKRDSVHVDLWDDYLDPA